MSEKDTLDYSVGAPNEGTTPDEPLDEAAPGVITSHVDDPVVPPGGGDEGEGSESEPTEAQKQIDNLQKQLNDTKSAFADSQASLHKLEGRLDQATAQPAAEIKDWLSEEFDEASVTADPHMAIDAVGRLRGEMVEVFKAQQALFDEKLKSNDPELFAHKDAITRLSADPDYSGFSKEQLAVVAKKEAAERAKEEAKPEMRGTPGGGKRPAAPEQKDVRQNSLFREIYGDEFDDKLKEKE